MHCMVENERSFVLFHEVAFLRIFNKVQAIFYYGGVYLLRRYIYPNTRLTYSNIRCTDTGEWVPQYVMAEGERIIVHLMNLRPCGYSKSPLMPRGIPPAT